MENSKDSTVKIVEDSLNFDMITDNKDDEDPILMGLGGFRDS